MPPEPHFDWQALDMSQRVADREGIRQSNPQRFEMEQLDAVVHVDTVNHILVGFKDVGEHEFWVRGHMPGYPLLPGVLMCEAAAQLCSYFCHVINLVEDGFIGFGGMEDVR